MSLLPAPPQSSKHSSKLASPGGQRDELGEEQAIPSEALLRGLACVAIDHEGMRYVLRATRAGKLILTK